MTVDEELNVLDESMRRLKIEYDIYFGGGSKRPPADTEWRVQSLIKKFSDSARLSFSQRFRYNSVVQKYAVMSDLWRKKLKIKEEGYSRPQDQMLGIQGIRTAEEHAAEAALAGDAPAASEPDKPFSVLCSDADADHAHVESLYKAMVAAKQKAGEAGGAASFDSFKTFVKKKTEQIRKDYGCHSVEYSVELENGQVRLKAKAKV
ncbi:MAG TPA: MXAN_5187 C-terminal domain-containing protein [Terriglobales bacterium]|nr:MXAN_5187 C-terminal domain-containing protein [Terriglobales bacterium]